MTTLANDRMAGAPGKHVCLRCTLVVIGLLTRNSLARIEDFVRRMSGYECAR